MRYTVVLLTPPHDTRVVAEADDEAVAVERARELVPTEGPGQFHMVYDGDHMLWTSEAGDLERVV